MQTIETVITVTSEGEILVPTRAHLAPGQHKAVLVIDETPAQSANGGAKPPLKLHVFALNGTAGATYRREDLYDDDGR
jgi:hypothetical protein